MNHRLLPLLSLALVLAPRAQASGFMLREQSAAGLGNAFAGSTAGQDVSSLFWNPAILPLFPGGQASLNGSWIGIHMDLSKATASRAPGFQAGDLPIQGPQSLPNAVSQPVLPALYASWGLTDRLFLGLSLNVPFGLVTDYPGDFIGRYHGLRTDLKTIDVAPALAFKGDSGWTFGVALVARKAEATLTNAVDFGAIGNSLGLPGFTPGQWDRSATLTGDAWAFGFKAGTTWQATPELRLGLAYQSQATLKIKGRIAYSDVPPPFDATFRNVEGDADLHLPATASGGFQWELSPQFSLQGEVAWTGWSTFKELRVRFASSQPDSVTDESWKDTWFSSLGGTFHVSSAWSFRAGFAYDRSPVDDRHRTPRIPDSDRVWVSAGAAWTFSPGTTLDLGFTRILARDVPLALRSGSDPSAPDFYRGNLSGSYKVGAVILAASLRCRF